MLDAPLIDWLTTDDGEAALRMAASLPSDTLTRLQRLRTRYPADRAAAAVELLQLRARAARKFGGAERMYFTAQGLEQASGDEAARWRASRFAAGAHVLDLCCGVGGDTVHLAGRGPVDAFDIDAAPAACARANLRSLDAGATATVRTADVTALALRGDAAFIDPSRRAGGRRARSAAEYAPPLAFLRELRDRLPVAAKLSPAIPDEELASLGGRVEFVSVAGECREAVAWFGPLGPAAERSASVLPAGAWLAADPRVPHARPSQPLGWLLEPDPAVIRAHLVAETAALFDARQLDPHIAWLTTDRHVTSPFVTAYRVVEALPFNLRRVQARLRALGRRTDTIKRRGVPLDPDALRRQLTGAGDLPTVVVLTRVADAVTAILCEPPDRAASAPDPHP